MNKTNSDAEDRLVVVRGEEGGEWLKWVKGASSMVGGGNDLWQSLCGIHGYPIIEMYPLKLRSKKEIRGAAEYHYYPRKCSGTGWLILKKNLPLIIGKFCVLLCSLQHK